MGGRRRRSRAAAAVTWSGSTSSAAIRSLTPKRPPGLSTRATSRSTAGLSALRLSTQLEITTSTDASGSGICSMRPRRISTLPAPMVFRRASSTISGVMSRPTTRPVGPTRRAESNRSRPAPLPRSRTVSPDRRSATRSGLPQPRLSTWSLPSSSAEYRDAPNEVMSGRQASAAQPVDVDCLGGVTVGDRGRRAGRRQALETSSTAAGMRPITTSAADGKQLMQASFTR